MCLKHRKDVLTLLSSHYTDFFIIFFKKIWNFKNNSHVASNKEKRLASSVELAESYPGRILFFSGDTGKVVKIVREHRPADVSDS